ncbi:MAG: ABC transporter substrate-binding protein, partial [Candidatus Bathyarchaeia archaeon]
MREIRMGGSFQRYTLLLPLLALLAMPLVGISVSRVSGQYATILVRGCGIPSTYNPILEPRDIEYRRNHLPLLFEPLVLQLYNGSVIPWLAKSWEIKVLENGTVHYIFHLDERAKWSDGVPFTAYDVEYTWQLIKDVQAGLYPFLVDVKALDEHTVVFIASQFNVRWALDYGEMRPLPKHIWEKIEDPLSYDFITKPEEHVTTGPFLYDSYKEGEWF